MYIYISPFFDQFWAKNSARVVIFEWPRRRDIHKLFQKSDQNWSNIVAIISVDLSDNNGLQDMSN